MEARIDLGGVFLRHLLRMRFGIDSGSISELFSRPEPRFHCTGAVFRKDLYFFDLFGFGSILHQFLFKIDVGNPIKSLKVASKSQIENTFFVRRRVLNNFVIMQL